jgi:hypothetical protein
MQYSARELRAVDMLAMVLVGFGLAAAVLGAALPRLRWIPCGIVLATMGFILNAKLRRIVRNGGQEEARAGKPVRSPTGPLGD